MRDHHADQRLRTTRVGSAAARLRSVALAIVTYRRPELLAGLLGELLCMDVPEQWQAVVIVVDNDPEASARRVFSEQRDPRHNLRYRYVVEGERGIPFARNRAIDEATRLGAEVLCFLDDDDYPDRRWLREILECRDQTGAHLVGGPAIPAPGDSPAGRWRRLVHNSVKAAARRSESRRTSMHKRGEPVQIATNNWLGDLGWINAQDLRFPCTHRFSSGEDTAFWRAARARGATCEWCETALVYQTVQGPRSTLRYLMRRAFSQSLSRGKALGTPSMRRIVFRSVPRIAFGALILIVPVYGLASLAIGARHVGAGLGAVASAAGLRHDLYESG